MKKFCSIFSQLLQLFPRLEFCCWNHDGYLPSYAVITDGKKSDITVARTMKFAAGTVLVMDRGYSHVQDPADAI